MVDYVRQMLAGPGTARFVVQPLAAITLGVIDGWRDVRQGRSAYRASDIGALLRRLAIPLICGTALSIIFQYVIRKTVILATAISFGAVFIALPYVLARALTCRALNSVRSRRWASGHGGPRRGVKRTPSRPTTA